MILLFSDIHFHNWSQFSTILPSGRNSRLQDTVNVVNDIYNHVVDKGITDVVFLGDLFHSRTKIDIDVYDAAWKAMQQLAQGANLYLLMGNHDSHNRNADVHSLEPFKEFAEVIDEPCRHTIGGYDIEAIPWMADKADFCKAADEAESADILIMHQDVKGGLLSSGIRSNGDLGTEDIQTEKYTKVFMGDYHKPQYLPPNMYYVGSPLQHNFGERGEEKSFVVCEGSDVSHSRVPTNAPKFWSFESPKEFAEAEGVDSDRDFIKIAYSGESLQEMANLVEQHSRICAVPQTNKEDRASRLDEPYSEDDLGLIDQWVRLQNKDSEDVDRLASLKSLGVELLNAEVFDD